MKASEVKEQEERIRQYRALEKVRDEIHAAIDAVTKPWPTGPCQQGPFTGNTRESRQVDSMTIQFSRTRGGSEAVSTEIRNMHISAWELGAALKTMLEARWALVQAEMEKI